MKTLLLLIGVVLGLVVASPSVGQDSLEQRKQVFQKALDNAPFHFKADEAIFIYSLTQFRGLCGWLHDLSHGCEITEMERT